MRKTRSFFSPSSVHDSCCLMKLLFGNGINYCYSIWNHMCKWAVG